MKGAWGAAAAGRGILDKAQLCPRAPSCVSLTPPHHGPSSILAEESQSFITGGGGTWRSSGILSVREGPPQKGMSPERQDHVTFSRVSPHPLRVMAFSGASAEPMGFVLSGQALLGVHLLGETVTSLIPRSLPWGRIRSGRCPCFWGPPRWTSIEWAAPTEVAGEEGRQGPPGPPCPCRPRLPHGGCHSCLALLEWTWLLPALSQSLWGISPGQAWRAHISRTPFPISARPPRCSLGSRSKACTPSLACLAEGPWGSRQDRLNVCWGLRRGFVPNYRRWSWDILAVLGLVSWLRED